LSTGDPVPRPANDAPEAERRAWEVACASSNEVPAGTVSRRGLARAEAAIALADRYAPDAPASLRDEAAIRAAAWIRDCEPGFARRSLADAGSSLDTEYRPSTAGALRASGGMGLLTAWRVRRVGAI